MATPNKIIYSYQDMLVINKTTQPDKLGRFQKIVSFIFLIIIQLALHGTIWLIALAVLTLNLNLGLMLIFIMIAQLPLRRNQKYIDFINKYVQPLKYFKKFEIVYEQIIKEKDRCIFGVHPHSVFGLSLLAILNSADDGPLSNAVGVSSRFILNFPFAGFFLKLWGFQAVNPKSLKRLMRKGKNIGIIPGGYEEATLTTSSEMSIWIQNRKGFIKYALESRYTIYPVIMMNEHKAFSTFPYFLKFRLFLNKLKIPGVLFWNKWSGVFLPPSLQLSLVIGKGIRQHLQSDKEVTPQLVDKVHAIYISELKRLYGKYAHLNENSPLKIY